MHISERTDDRPRHVALRVFRFLGGGRNGIKTDVGEEDNGRSGQDAAVAVLAECSRIRRDELQAIADARLAPDAEIMRVHISDARDDEKQDDADLDHHDDRIEIRRFLNSSYQQSRHSDRDQHAGRLKYAVSTGTVNARPGSAPCQAHPSGRSNPPTDSKPYRRPSYSPIGPLPDRRGSRTAFPGAALSAMGKLIPKSASRLTIFPDQPDRDGRRPKCVLQDQVPADDPRDELSQSRVTIGIGRA